MRYMRQEPGTDPKVALDVSFTCYGHRILSLISHLWRLDPYVISNWHTTLARNSHVSTILGRLEPRHHAKLVAKLASLGSSPADRSFHVCLISPRINYPPCPLPLVLVLVVLKYISLRFPPSDLAASLWGGLKLNKGTKLNCITRRMYSGSLAGMVDSKGRNVWAARVREWLDFSKEETASGDEEGGYLACYHCARRRQGAGWKF